jgi:hypothetical protein
MRMMMIASMPVEKGNELIRDGKLGPMIQKILGDLKPEAAYFTADELGQRSAYIFFEMANSSELPKVAEPWFLGFDAQVTVRPVMNPQDLAAAGPHLENAAKSY